MQNQNGTYGKLIKDGNSYVIRINGSKQSTWLRTTEPEIAQLAFDYLEAQGTSEGFKIPNYDRV